MEFGVFMFPTDTAIRPDHLATAVEKRGFASLWFPEHSHIPTSRRTPWGGVKDAPSLPEMYWRSTDAFVSLSYAAAVTETLQLGTGITLVAQRDPIWTAKQVASLDHLSGGRVLFGVGYGWNKEEMAHHGVRYTNRRAVMREKILMMKSLWTDDEASFEGKHLQLDSSWAWPKPAQKPHPPILMGASAGRETVKDMVEYCNGWLPLATRMDIGGQVKIVRRAVEKAGRDPDAFRIIAYSVNADQVDAIKKAGVDGAIFTLPPLGPDVTIPRLDKLARQVALS
jgi:probable F420-dependent oxidoreductase